MMKTVWVLILALTLGSCSQKKSVPAAGIKTYEPGTFGFDVDFVKSFKNVVVLGIADAKVLVVGDYQGRVMTSTATGDCGNSYGWINYDLIRSGRTMPHMNPYGGEDRFWLGPEGGQYALYFKKGDLFDFDHWQTPAVIDTEPFELLAADSVQATFRKNALITNYQGASFELEIFRQIALLGKDDIEREFGVSTGNARVVAYESLNEVWNRGADWNKDTGLISIWILGMFKPSEGTCIVLPHDQSDDRSSITDNYFGVIPKERIVETDRVLFLRGDGKFRGKVGIAPSVARNVAGSYDAEKHILTIIKFDLDKAGSYVNSKWETQKFPYGGDAVNAYNDGPQADGSQLGPFYELESSSPVVALRKGEAIRHRHVTMHAEGSEQDLNELAEKILGVGLDEIKTIFKGSMEKD